MGSFADCVAIAPGTGSDDSEGSDELHRIFSGGIRFFIRRKLGSRQIEQRVRETFAVVTSVIQAESRGKGETLAHLVRAVVLEQITAYTIQDEQRRNEGSTPVPDYIRRENREAIIAVLGRSSRRDREALVRFYSHKHPPVKICAEMQLSEAQFLLLKKRFKAAVNKTLTISEGLPRATGPGRRCAGFTGALAEACFKPN